MFKSRRTIRSYIFVRVMKMINMIYSVHSTAGKLICYVVFYCLFTSGLSAQPKYYTTQNAHSHNDYEQKIPFRMAYDQQFGSIEADIFLKGSELIVAHNEKELKNNRSFKTLYLRSLDSCVGKNDGYPYRDSTLNLQLLIDIKTDSVKTLEHLIALLNQFPAIIHNRHIFLVITGNRPNPDSFAGYPNFIWFDGVLSKSYTRDQLSRLKMLSDNFKDYSHWNGEGHLPVKDAEKLNSRITQAHRDGIPVRLWNAPDFANAWGQFIQLKVDYINTDHIAELSQYLRARAQLSVNH
jgi:alkaline phosphatase